MGDDLGGHRLAGTGAATEQGLHAEAPRTDLAGTPAWYMSCCAR